MSLLAAIYKFYEMDTEEFNDVKLGFIPVKFHLGNVTVYSLLIFAIAWALSSIAIFLYSDWFLGLIWWIISVAIILAVITIFVATLKYVSVKHKSTESIKEPYNPPPKNQMAP
jgi:VIT1/CCC1 family predicted Fe2+/Mn2+ transporter